MAHNIIRRIKVTGGFLDGIDLRFAPGLNCVIGGRGTGKTTLLEFIRYALGLGGRTDAEVEARLDKLLKGNLNNGMVEIEFETADGLIYVVKRAYKEKAMVFDTSGAAVDPRILESGMSINAAIYSQNQIETIAGDTAAQKELLDRFLRREISAVQQDIQRKLTELKSNASHLQLLEQNLQGEEINLQDLPAMKDRLEKLNKELASQKIEPEVEAASKAKRRRDAETTAIDGLPPQMDRVRAKLRPLRDGLFSGLEDAIPKTLLEGPNSDLFINLKKAMDEGVKTIQDHIEKSLSRLDRMDTAVTETANELKKRHTPEDAAYHEILAKKKDAQAKIKDRDTLAKQIAAMEAKRLSRSQIEEQIKTVRAARDKLMWEYSDLCEKRFLLRSQMALKLNNLLGERVRIHVHQQSDTAEYSGFLTNMMVGSGKHYRDKIPKVVSSVPPRQVVKLSETEDVPGLAEASGINEDFSRALIDVIRKNPENMRQLETMDVDDAVEVHLNTGTDWKPTDKLSTGQKCSAILPLLLLNSEAPLLIDQPEDNLDNSYVSGTVVPKLNEAQENRQMIFVTHNPNIPVLGNAQKIIVMESDGKQSKLLSGSVDEMKNEIIGLLEGGLDAFEERRKRYQNAGQASGN